MAKSGFYISKEALNKGWGEEYYTETFTPTHNQG